MAIVKRRWLDNAFWENHQKDRITAILEVTDERGRRTTQVVNVRKTNDQGRNNQDFYELIRTVGREKIDANTAERHERKQREQRERVEREQSAARTKMLEQLFDAKIQALEIDEIKQSTNKELKRKLRKSNNMIELNLYAMMIVMEEQGLHTFVKADETE